MPTVTVNLSGASYGLPPVLCVGQLIKMPRHKRIYGKVSASSYTNATIVYGGYKPAPKSKLRKSNKSVFSKKKHKLII